jgi:hypothetical protein
LLLSTIFQVESLRELEIELDSSTLVPSLQCILNANIDFGTIESAVSRVEGPFTGIMFIKNGLETLKG